MNCYFHDDRPAVVACEGCGVGLCRDCADSYYTKNGRPLCINCSREVAVSLLGEAKSRKFWSLVKCIFSGFFLLIGLLALAAGAGLENVWIISGVAGIPGAFNASRRSREERALDDIEDRFTNDITDLTTNWLLRLLLRVAAIIFLAPLFALGTFITNLFGIFRNNKRIRETQETLASIDRELYGAPEPTLAGYPQNGMNALDSAAMQPGMPEQPAAPTYQGPAPSSYKAPAASYKTSAASGRSGFMIVGIVAGVLVVLGLVAGYMLWYAPYAKDRDALRTYVVADNVFLRSSQLAGVEHNILQKVPYGSELITYSKGAEWAEVKLNGVKGFVASAYLSGEDDFRSLNNIWGSTDTKEYIESSKCRLALIDYCRRNQLVTGSQGWQLHTLQKDVKPNNVLFPRLNNGYDKFTEFAFILKNNATQERRFVIYSFNEETEMPVFLYEEAAPAEGQIKAVKYTGRDNAYRVSYTGNGTAANRQTGKEASSTASAPATATNNTSVPEVEHLTIVEDDDEPVTTTFVPPVIEDEEPKKEVVDDNRIYDNVDQMPLYPNGGGAGLMSFIARNVKYPSSCMKNGIQGKVIVSFVIEKDGSPGNFQVTQSVHPELDKEALRVLKSMPKWQPGKKQGVPVRVKYSVPVNFKLS